MNWVEIELKALAGVEPDPYIVWLSLEALAKRCDHRFTARANPLPPLARGFYRLDLICVCTRCGAAA